MLPRSRAALATSAVLAATLLTGAPAGAATIGDLPSLPGGGSGGGSQSADSPRPRPQGSVSAPDQVLRKGCSRYRVDYRVKVPGDQWSAEIFVKNSSGRGIHAFAVDSNAPSPKVGSKRYKLCRASTRYGTHRLRMKVTYCPDSECEEPIVEGFVTPGTFRFLRPRAR